MMVRVILGVTPQSGESEFGWIEIKRPKGWESSCTNSTRYTSGFVGWLRKRRERKERKRKSS
jgi:hypothetical protein